MRARQRTLTSTVSDCRPPPSTARPHGSLNQRPSSRGDDRGAGWCLGRRLALSIRQSQQLYTTSTVAPAAAAAAKRLMRPSEVMLQAPRNFSLWRPADTRTNETWSPYCITHNTSYTVSLFLGSGFRATD